MLCCALVSCPFCSLPSVAPVLNHTNLLIVFLVPGDPSMDRPFDSSGLGGGGMRTNMDEDHDKERYAR